MSEFDNSDSLLNILKAEHEIVIQREQDWGYMVFDGQQHDYDDSLLEGVVVVYPEPSLGSWVVRGVVTFDDAVRVALRMIEQRGDHDSGAD